MAWLAWHREATEREATGGNGKRAESDETGKPHSGRQREATGTEPVSARKEPILKRPGEDPLEQALFGEKCLFPEKNVSNV